jgi:hypothetical protein
MSALNIATIIVSALSITISAHTITTTKKRLAGIQSNPRTARAARNARKVRMP